MVGVCSGRQVEGIRASLEEQAGAHEQGTALNKRGSCYCFADRAAGCVVGGACQIVSNVGGVLQLKELKTELGTLRVAKVTGGAPNKLAKMYAPVACICVGSVPPSLPSAKLCACITSDPNYVCSKTVRKSIACVLTVISHNQRSALREALKGQKYLPLDLRAKKTRALRRALSTEQVCHLFYPF